MFSDAKRWLAAMILATCALQEVVSQSPSATAESRPTDRAESRPAPLPSITLEVTDSAIVPRPDDSELVKSALAKFVAAVPTFTAEVTDRKLNKDVETARVEFPSGFPIGSAMVDRCILHVWRPAGEKLPVVLLLHHLLDNFGLQRDIARKLANRGIAAALLEFPGYGGRRDRARVQPGFLSEDVEASERLLRQAAGDTLRSIDVLRAFPGIDASRVTTMGISLGALIGGLAAGVDGGRFRTVLVMGGGDLAKITLTPSRETRRMRESLMSAGIDEADLRDALIAVEPLTFAKRIRGADLLSFAAEGDTVVPPDCTRRLLEAIDGAEAIVWPGSHVSMPFSKMAEIIDRTAGLATRPAAAATSGAAPGPR